MSSGDLYWSAVCGNDSQQDLFWSEALTLNTTNPDLTSCFQDTVLVWMPCAVLWISCIFYLPSLCRRHDYHERCGSRSRLNMTKIVLESLLCILTAIQLVYTVYPRDETFNDSNITPYIKYTVLLISYVLATFLGSYEFQKGVHSGGVLFFFWFLTLLINIVPFRSLILKITYDEQGRPHMEDLFLFSTFYISFALITLLFCLSLFGDTEAPLEVKPAQTADEQEPLLGNTYTKSNKKILQNDKKAPCPEVHASFLSRITFSWITPLIIYGYKHSITYRDLPDILTEDKSATLQPVFNTAWADELRNTNYRLLAAERSANETSGKKKNKSPSVWMAIVRTYGLYYLCAGLFKLAYDFVSFLNPLLLNLMISFIGSGSMLTWQGYVYAVGMFIVSMIKTFTLQQYWDMCFRTGMRLRTVATGAIYRKSLRLSNAAKRLSTIGEVVNLMSVDAQKIQDAPAYMHMIWSTPVTIALATYFLWQQLGPSVLAGVAIMFLLIPLNALVATKTRTLQISQMRFKDNRIKLMNEVLNGIKVLKLYGWEGSFRDRVLGIRDDELKVLKTAMYLSAVSSISWFMTPYLVALATFGVYVMSSPDHILDANKAFVSLSLFNLLNYPMSILPAVLTYGVQAAVSIGRITRFLKNEEIDPDSVEVNRMAELAVEVRGATFSWDRLEAPILNNIELPVPEGHLIAVVGKVGSGKSSLLSAILGEMEKLRGTVTIKSSIAYVPQQAWIQNKSLQDNIKFGRVRSDRSYQNVLEACALTQDLKILPAGDLTEIGEKGINLSGGQKQRVSLARSLYQDCDIYLLDDPLSAVDAHVGKHIFDHVIGPNGLLKHKTRIFVTNSITYLKEMDRIVVLRHGQISEMGTFDELLRHKGAFAEFLMTYFNEDEDEEEIDEEQAEVKSHVLQQLSSLSGVDMGVTIETDSDQRSSVSAASSYNRLKHRGSKFDGTSKRSKSVCESGVGKGRPAPIQRLTEDEVAMTGTVKFSVFWGYIRACGLSLVVVSLVAYTMTIVAQIGGNIWLSEWSNDQPTVNGTQDPELRDLRLGVYGGIGAVQGTCVLFQGLTQAMACVMACRVLHVHLLRNILRAPMSFYDTTPLGRILNRFSRDIDVLDVNIPLTIRIWLGTFSSVIATIVVISYSTPIFLVVALPLGLFYYLVQRFYISMSRQVKRLDSVQRSPIYAHFSETVSGASSIRAYRKQEDFINKSDLLVDKSQITYFPSIISNRWIGLWLEVISNAIVLFAGVFAVLEKDQITAGLAGLSVSYALQITGSLNMWVRMTSDMEIYVVAVERIKEYADCPQEAPEIIEGNRPPCDWPQSGHVTFQHYATRYRAGLDLVLTDINCQIVPKERVGIVGRTGAGKSSLTLALFRIIEAAMGNIVIDGINISNIGLLDLRSRLTIIPQDPVLFAGTLRMNLDPFEKHTDSEVWRALKQAHLNNYVSELPATLQHECTEGGENLSVGQRQLVCLARALLRKTRILVLDEATAAVDLETDDMIQLTIRSEFTECTVITIAHRLNTIMDCDRVMVLSDGRITEFDDPGTLLKNSRSVFYSMARDAGLVNSNNS